MYQVFYHKKVVKQIKNLHHYDQKKVVKKINELKDEPESPSPHIKRLHGTDKSWRLRIGNIRAIYTLNHETKMLIVVKVGYRGRVYKK